MDRYIQTLSVLRYPFDHMNHQEEPWKIPPIEYGREQKRNDFGKIKLGLDPENQVILELQMKTGKYG